MTFTLFLSFWHYCNFQELFLQALPSKIASCSANVAIWDPVLHSAKTAVRAWGILKVLKRSECDYEMTGLQHQTGSSFSHSLSLGALKNFKRYSLQIGWGSEKRNKSLFYQCKEKFKSLIFFFLNFQAEETSIMYKNYSFCSSTIEMELPTRILVQAGLIWWWQEWHLLLMAVQTWIKSNDYLFNMFFLLLSFSGDGTIPVIVSVIVSVQSLSQTSKILSQNSRLNLYKLWGRTKDKFSREHDFLKGPKMTSVPTKYPKK